MCFRKKAKKVEAKPAEKKPTVTKESVKPTEKEVTPKVSIKKEPAKNEPTKEVGYRNYHVVKREDGKWEVKFAGGKKAIKLFATQAEAVAYTKKMADNQDGSVLVHNSKGKNKGRIKAK